MQIAKSWILREIYSLPDDKRVDDTTYVRYSFQKDKVYISFYPGWDDGPRELEMEGSQLKIGLANYIIDSVTDSTLYLSTPGFRHVILENETYLSRDSAYLHKIGEFNNLPLYEANRQITPRYKKEHLGTYIAQNLEGYNIKRAITFMASFIIGKDGKVYNVQILHGISDGFDAEVIKKLRSTSGDWTPALFRGEPVQAQIIYTIKYLDSIVK